MLAFEQKRLHRLGNSFDGKYVFVFQQAVFEGWLTHFTHQSAMHGFEVKNPVFYVACVCDSQTESNTLKESRVEHLCVCGEARQCHLLITIWTD